MTLPRSERRKREKEHGDFDAVGRIDEQHVARIDAPEDDERHRRGEYREEPRKRPHPGLRSRRDL